VALPGSPHGLNHYVKFDHCVITAALNPSPAERSFMETIGLSDDDIDTAIFVLRAYQAIMRTSLRLPNDGREHILVVPTKYQASKIAAMFETSEVQFLDSPVRAYDEFCASNKSLPLEGSKRTILSRNRQKVQDALQAIDIPDIDIERLISTTQGNFEITNEGIITDVISRKCNEIDPYSYNVTKIEGTETFIHFPCVTCVVTPFRQIDIEHHSFLENRRVCLGGNDEKQSWADLVTVLGGIASGQIQLSGTNSTICAYKFGSEHRDGKRWFGNTNAISTQLIFFETSNLNIDELAKALAGIELFGFQAGVQGRNYRLIFPIAFAIPANLYRYVWYTMRAYLEEAIPGCIVDDQANALVNRLTLPVVLYRRACPTFRLKGLPINPLFFLMRYGLK
jgi:hypothetical protein